MAVTTVAIGDLDDWLTNQPDNDASTPYELNITGLDNSYIVSSAHSGSLGSILNDHFNRWGKKYVDLRPTTMPTGITSWRDVFEYCSGLVYAPTIPNDVTDLNSTFSNSGLVDMPVIPNGVTNMDNTFRYCEKLVNSTVLPDSVTDMYETFDGCESLLYRPIYSLNATDRTHTYDDIGGWRGTLAQFKLYKDEVTATYNRNYEIQIYNSDRVTYEESIWAVTISSLSDWLSEKPSNTVELPYKIILKGAVYSADIREALTENEGKYVDLSMSSLSIGDTDLRYAFNGCMTLIKAPSFSVFSIGNGYARMFYQCQNLKYVQPFPKVQVTDLSMHETFYNCKALETVPSLPLGVADMYGTFRGCESLTTAPTIPNTVTTLYECFRGCESLTTAPEIPNSVTTMVLTFNECIRLQTAPVIPSSVTDIRSAFEDCESLEIVPNIPSSVTSAENAFTNCPHLKKISLFEIPLNTLKSSEYFRNMFSNCPRLDEIGYKIDDINWHVWKLNIDSNTVSGKIFNRNGDSTDINEGTAVSITKSDIKLPVLTDELWFPDEETSAQIDTLIGKMITYKYGVFNRETIPPDEKTMVLWADDKSHFKTNIEMGGGIKMYDTISDAEQDLPNLEVGALVGTNDGINFNTVDEVTSGVYNPVTSNAVANALSYSTTEFKTGGMFGGRPIYKKLIEKTSFQYDTYIGNVLSNARNVLSFNFAVIDQTQDRVYSGNLTSATASYITEIYYVKSENRIYYKGGNSRGTLFQAYFVFEYTKTTD